ncbi:unnamed protein product [Rhizophagus irregularis]|nr:unnamed protein product [Rhizophagus irregularis]
MPKSTTVVFLRGVSYTILPALTALTSDGFIACDNMKDSCSKERFCSFVLSQINHYPEKNSVLVWMTLKYTMMKN